MAGGQVAALDDTDMCEKDVVIMEQMTTTSGSVAVQSAVGALSGTL